MRTLFFLIVSLFFFSCKKEKPMKEILSTKLDLIKVDSDLTTNENKERIKTDTIFFNYDEKVKLNDYALISILDKKYTEDSISTATFKIDFMLKKQLVYSHQLKVKNIDNGSQWYGNLELDSVASPLKTITLGYPACGYAQQNFLFYTNGERNNLIYNWTSSSDSGWGEWGKIVTGRPDNFVFRIEAFVPDEEETINDEDEKGIVQFSDSIHFYLKNNSWVKSLKTPKSKVYRSKKLSFNKFHKLN